MVSPIELGSTKSQLPSIYLASGIANGDGPAVFRESEFGLGGASGILCECRG